MYSKNEIDMALHDTLTKLTIDVDISFLEKVEMRSSGHLSRIDK